MPIYLTHCSAQKADWLKGTGQRVTPDLLYTDLQIQQFMERCKQKNVPWAILSDRYGIYQSTDYQVWYEKHPDTVTPQEEADIIQDLNHKLEGYDKIYFFVRPTSFHLFYERVLNKTKLSDRIQYFQDVNQIEST